MDGSAVNALRDLSRESFIVEVGDLKFAPKDFKPIYHQPRPDAITVKSLTAIRDYLTANIDKIDLSKLLVHVKDYDNVVLLSDLNGVNRERDMFMSAMADVPEFKFGEWMDPERFKIGLQALFIANTDRDALLKYTASLKIEDEAGLIDDGITQTASARVGVRGGLTEQAVANPRPVLKPYRTFTELEQPESEFVFRMRRKNGDGAIELALFEADGGAWKRVAMERIVDWFKHLGDLSSKLVVMA